MSSGIPFQYRIFVDVFLLVSIFVAPWWLSLAVIAIAIFLFKNFYESFVFAILMDGFHGVPGVSFWGFNMFFIATVGVVFFVSLVFKPRLKFYDQFD